MSDSHVPEWMRIAQAAAISGLSAPTLRRLCEQGVLPGRRQGRNWMVRASDVQRYVMARPTAGAPRANVRLAGPAARYRGEAPNPRIRDAEGFLFGWRFEAAVDDDEIPFSIWLSDELVHILRDEGRDPRELVVRAAENLVQEVMLERETLPRNHEIALGSRDRLRLLRAAGLGPDHYRPSEAPLEVGALVIYELTARDTVWIGDRVPVIGETSGWIDAVVGSTHVDGRRRVRTVRLRTPTESMRRADLVRSAIAAYRRRCRRLHQTPGEWLAEVKAQVSAARVRRSA